MGAKQSCTAEGVAETGHGDAGCRREFRRDPRVCSEKRGLGLVSVTGLGASFPFSITLPLLQCSHKERMKARPTGTANPRLGSSSGHCGLEGKKLPRSPGPCKRPGCRAPLPSATHTPLLYAPRTHLDPLGTGDPVPVHSGSHSLTLPCPGNGPGPSYVRPKPAGGGYHIGQEQGDLLLTHRTGILEERESWAGVPSTHQGLAPVRGLRATAGSGPPKPGPPEPMPSSQPCPGVQWKLSP